MKKFTSLKPSYTKIKNISDGSIKVRKTMVKIEWREQSTITKYAIGKGLTNISVMHDKNSKIWIVCRKNVILKQLNNSYDCMAYIDALDFLNRKWSSIINKGY